MAITTTRHSSKEPRLCFFLSFHIDHFFFQHDTIHTIQEALAHITQPQLIQMTHSSSRPGKMTIDASQRVLIDALPPILVLHVKRFCYDVNVGGVVKVMKQVRFGPELEIGSGMFDCLFLESVEVLIFV